VTALELEDLFQHGRQHLDTGDTAAAGRCFLTILQAQPDAVSAWLMLGVSFRLSGELQGAIETYQEGLNIAPDSVELLINLGQTLHSARRPEEAEATYERALAIRPETLAKRGLVQSLVGRNAWEDAERVYERFPPATLAERWDQARILPIVYRDGATTELMRARYHSRLQALSRGLVDSDGPLAWDAAQDAFHLHYLEGSHREEQRLLGGMLARAGATIPVQTPARPAAGEKIRVCFASSVLCDHTVARLFGGWIEQLDRKHFEVLGFHLGQAADATTARLASMCSDFVHSPLNPIAAARAIQQRRVHAIVFPELGMDVTTLKLASLRLAPLQMCTWGHPVTTGLPTVDIFLSSEWMEPPGGEADYTEEVVRLPHLGLTVGPPAVAPAPQSRRDIGLPEGAIVLLTTQSLFKLLPQYDAWYVDLLETVPDAVLVFLSHPSQGVMRAFQERFSAAVAGRGMRPQTRVVFLANQPWDRFLALNRCSDVFLDAPGWSGGMTTLDAVSQGLVPVTRPGPQMRQRHTAAILKALGIDDTIAPDRAGWVRAAARVATDRSFREGLQARIQAGLPRLYRDPAPLRALEALIVDRLR
jgi:predicted O-linked N-acetylglucosamine transferase (SPINDLY family)